MKVCYIVIMKPSKLQDIIFQTPQNMDKLECVLKILRDGNALFRANNAISQDKIVELKTKLNGSQNSSSNSLPPLSPHYLMLPKQKKFDKKRKIRVHPGHKPHSRTFFVPKELDKIRNFAPKLKTYSCGRELIIKPAEDIM